MFYRCRLKITVLLCLLVFPVLMFCAEVSKPFKRHFIIVVDQTLPTDRTKYMLALNQAINKWLQGEDPIPYLVQNSSVVPKIDSFDENDDAISLFAFGLVGSGMPSVHGEYGRIHAACYKNRYSPKYMFDDIKCSLIHKRDRYRNGVITSSSLTQVEKADLVTFFNKSMRTLFDGTDPLHVAIKQNSGITMSHFIYPLIMDFVPKNETANEYYLIVVSDFKSGLYSNNDQDDWNTLVSMTAGNKDVKAFFEHQINVMRAPFVQADFMHFQSQGLAAKGTRLIHKSVVMKSQLNLSSSLSLSQKKGNEFNLSKAIISFSKDKATTIDSIGVMLIENNNVLCHRIITRGDSEAEKLKTKHNEYEIPDQSSLNLTKSTLGDVMVKYVFYTMTHDDEGNNVLPVSLTSQQLIDKSNITYINEQLRKIMTIIGLVSIFILVVALMYWRGLKKKVEVQISRFAQKYVNVTKDRGAVELPCWFYVKGNNLNKIKVSGNVATCRMFSIKGMRKLYVRLQDAKPKGFDYYINAQACKDFVPVRLKNGCFSFELDININPNIVDVAQLHACSVTLDFKVITSLFGFFEHSDIGISPNVYEFYFIEDLGRGWVGFDPGTSGSCVALGNPSGPLNNPNITMVEVSRGQKKTNIIPSKIIFDKALQGKTPMSMLPDTDYMYGIKADVNWEASRNLPHFQSIKKLLGYKKAANDRIEVRGKDGVMEMTGVDLAHLLVKGLDRDLLEYIANLPSLDKMRFTNDGKCPRRAVVAIPNNYTLPKIQDMIESVSRLNHFKEIRFIYEAEGVLFNYLRKTFGEKHSGSENIMVYDMGGATINLTVFRVKYINKNSSIYYNIETLGRIGYAVGGDNIDVALMERIFAMNSRTPYEKHEYEKKHKTELLKKMYQLKLNILNVVDKQADPGLLGVLYDKESFMKFAHDQQGSLSVSNTIEDALKKFSDSENFAHDMRNDIINSPELEEYVYSKVKDAVSEILKYPDVENIAINKIIFAGRSTIFPKIRDMVNDVLNKHSKNCKSVDIFNDEEIKTSVAYGACWYGIYNGLVTLDNSRLSSAYGFKHTTGVESDINILLNQNSVFGDDNMVHGGIDLQSLFDGDGQTVSFYQIMGSGTGKSLLAESNRYKVNYLTGIPVTQCTKRISIDVGRNNFVTCSVTFDTNMTESRSDLDIQTRDIAEENDWAYVFATTDEDAGDVAQSEKYTASKSQSQSKTVSGSNHTEPQYGKWYDNVDKSKKIRRF